MLNNRILIISTDKRFLDNLSKIKSEYIFIHLDHPTKYKTSSHFLEALIFDSQMFLNLGEILKDYKNKPVYGIGQGPAVDNIRWLPHDIRPDQLEEILVNDLGSLRAPPQNTGEIKNGVIVKNKTFASWGPGVVIKELPDDLFLIRFPQALKITKKEQHICHKTTLRIICSITELTNETH